MEDALAQLIALLGRLPGIGQRTATRLAIYLLSENSEFAERLGQNIATIHRRIQKCQRCQNFTEQPICKICVDATRTPSSICVVAQVIDLWAIERSATFNGKYYVLHGLLAPLDGTGPQDLNLEPLCRIAEDPAVQEVIIATPLSVDGQATALLISQTLKDAEVKITRLASGLPHGAELEYSDRVTLERSFEARHAI